MSDEAQPEEGRWLTPEEIEEVNRHLTDIVTERADILPDIMRHYAAHAKRQAVVRVPYQATDAALTRFFTVNDTFDGIRHQVTTGSTQYIVIFREDPNTTLGIFTAEMVGFNRTYLNVSIPAMTLEDSDDAPLIAGYVVNGFWVFINWLAEYQQQMKQLDKETLDLLNPASELFAQHQAEIQQIQQDLSQKKQLGRPPYNENTKARNRIDSGDDKEEVYQQWAQTRGADPDDDETRELFRKNMDYKPSRKK